MEQGFRFLDHTSDAKFQAFGRTMEEAFTNAALATASLMWDVKTIARTVRHPVLVRGRDLEQLLVNFLGEIIYLVETQRFILGTDQKIRIRKISGEYVLKGVFWGDSDPGKYRIFGEVKAVTYNEMKIEKNGHVTVQVVVDI
jgi:SHS2 domain-containing protein